VVLRATERLIGVAVPREPPAAADGEDTSGSWHVDVFMVPPPPISETPSTPPTAPPERAAEGAPGPAPSPQRTTGLASAADAPTEPILPSPLVSEPIPLSSPVSPAAPTEPEVATAPEAPPAHISEQPRFAETFAEAGAEEGAGAAVHVEEPWKGYGQMTAKEVIARLADAGREELAAVALYERAHRGRQTVLAAAERQLRRAVATDEHNRD